MTARSPVTNRQEVSRRGRRAAGRLFAGYRRRWMRRAPTPIRASLAWASAERQVYHWLLRPAAPGSTISPESATFRPRRERDLAARPSCASAGAQSAGRLHRTLTARPAPRTGGRPVLPVAWGRGDHPSCTRVVRGSPSSTPSLGASPAFASADPQYGSDGFTVVPQVLAGSLARCAALILEVIAHFY